MRKLLYALAVGGLLLVAWWQVGVAGARYADLRGGQTAPLPQAAATPTPVGYPPPPFVESTPVEYPVPPTPAQPAEGQQSTQPVGASGQQATIPVQGGGLPWADIGVIAVIILGALILFVLRLRR